RASYGSPAAAVARTGIKRNPFHPFSCFDTVTLGGSLLGQTVLARAAEAAGLPYDAREAHSAIYDAEMTADLFCTLINRVRPLFEGIGLPRDAAAVEAEDGAASA
ncbi:hypothetical protein B1810_05080, partial [Panacagrimonas perspica]